MHIYEKRCLSIAELVLAVDQSPSARYWGFLSLVDDWELEDDVPEAERSGKRHCVRQPDRLSSPPASQRVFSSALPSAGSEAGAGTTPSAVAEVPLGITPSSNAFGSIPRCSATEEKAALIAANKALALERRRAMCKDSV
jgi:hypothetical protein